MKPGVQRWWPGAGRQGLPRIEQTTEVALNFNDRLDGRELSEEDVKELFGELSKLGETLETRFEMEDFLIEHLHNAHAGKVASA